MGLPFPRHGPTACLPRLSMGAACALFLCKWWPKLEFQEVVLLIHCSVVCLTPFFQSSTLPLIFFFGCLVGFKIFPLFNPCHFKFSLCSKDVEISFYSFDKEWHNWMFNIQSSSNSQSPSRDKTLFSVSPASATFGERAWYSRQNSALAVQKLMPSPGSDLYCLGVIGQVISLLRVSFSVVWIQAGSGSQPQSSAKARVEQMETSKSTWCPGGPPLGKANNLRSWSPANLLCSSSLRLIKALERCILYETWRLEPDHFGGLLVPKLGDYHGRDWVLKQVGEYCWNCCCYAWGVPSRKREKSSHLTLWFLFPHLWKGDNNISSAECSGQLWRAKAMMLWLWSWGHSQAEISCIQAPCGKMCSFPGLPMLGTKI